MRHRVIFWQTALIALAILTTVAVDAEAQTPVETLEPQYCSAYGEFLGVDEETQISQCSVLEEFVVSSEAMTADEFLTEFIEVIREESVIGTLAQGVLDYRSGNIASAFSSLDAADRRVFSAHIARGDEPRAYLYAIFLSSSKAAILNLRADALDAEVHAFATAAELFGDQQYAYLDTVDPVHVLYCFLRTDALTTQVPHVIRSRPFNLCLVSA